MEDACYDLLRYSTRISRRSDIHFIIIFTERAVGPKVRYDVTSSNKMLLNFYVTHELNVYLCTYMIYLM
jgi:hypothetical protein